MSRLRASWTQNRRRFADVDIRGTMNHASPFVKRDMHGFEGIYRRAQSSVRSRGSQKQAGRDSITDSVRRVFAHRAQTVNRTSLRITVPTSYCPSGSQSICSMLEPIVRAAFHTLYACHNGHIGDRSRLLPHPQRFRHHLRSPAGSSLLKTPSLHN